MSFSSLAFGSNTITTPRFSFEFHHSHVLPRRSFVVCSVNPAVSSASKPSLANSTGADRIGRLGSLSQVSGVLGSQWGDEGKGKLVDILAQHFDIVARCQVYSHMSFCKFSCFVHIYTSVGVGRMGSGAKNRICSMTVWFVLGKWTLWFYLRCVQILPFLSFIGHDFYLYGIIVISFIKLCSIFWRWRKWKRFPYPSQKYRSQCLYLNFRDHWEAVNWWTWIPPIYFW